MPSRRKKVRKWPMRARPFLMFKNRPDINLRIVESSVNICRFALNDTYQDKNGYAYMQSRGVKLYGNTGKNHYLASLQSHSIQEDIFNNAPTQLNAIAMK